MIQLEIHRKGDSLPKVHLIKVGTVAEMMHEYLGTMTSILSTARRQEDNGISTVSPSSPSSREQMRTAPGILHFNQLKQSVRENRSRVVQLQQPRVRREYDIV